MTDQAEQISMLVSLYGVQAPVAQAAIRMANGDVNQAAVLLMDMS